MNAEHNNNAYNKTATYIYDADGNWTQSKQYDGAGNVLSFRDSIRYKGDVLWDETGAPNQPNTWTDYVYALGKRIASIADARVVKAMYYSGVRDNNVCASNYWLGAQASALNGYAVRNGDSLEFDHMAVGAQAGLSLGFTDGSFSGDGTDHSPDGQWRHFAYDMSPYAGKVIGGIVTGTQSSTPAGTAWTVWYGRATLRSSDGPYNRSTRPEIRWVHHGADVAAPAATTLSSAVTRRQLLPEVQPF